ncbi:hypothetical protein QUF72_12225, partial [Desulfobacterales bacterium HSG2]|nr:hypothetical protein [Desulfobacterales bacterium HSG2]
PDLKSEPVRHRLLILRTRRKKGVGNVRVRGAEKPVRRQQAANEGKSFQGSTILGSGFVLSPEGAQRLVDKDQCNSLVLFPYLSGEDVNSDMNQAPRRWVINFRNWPLDRNKIPPNYSDPVASDFPDCLTIVEEKVKPTRLKNKVKSRRELWWQFTRPTLDLYHSISGEKYVIVASRVTKYVVHAIVPCNYVYDVGTNVILFSYQRFAILSASLFDVWVHKYASTLETRIRYTLTDCFETFPFPEVNDDLEKIGQEYHQHRQAIMKSRQQGLTTTYNRFHNEDENDSDIVKLRELHIQTDNAVARAYGWTDLSLEHDFHETRQGIRFTLSESARREVLDRLLRLNHERYAEEVALGLHDKGKKKKTTRKPRKTKIGKGKKQENGKQMGIFSEK